MRSTLIIALVVLHNVGQCRFLRVGASVPDTQKIAEAAWIDYADFFDN
jgi:hypothetical protein